MEPEEIVDEIGRATMRVDLEVAASLRACVLFGECARQHKRHHQVVVYSSDLTDAQWNLLEPQLLLTSKRGPKKTADLRHVVDAMLYISHTGCQWRFLPDEFGPRTRVWS
jgi:hypothetical protein